ncbi:MAG: hypothetical protein IJO48_05380 [Clostridia bacterium]|nr:hypothetical protein [Clostridia bacterium]
MKKVLALMMVLVMLASAFVGCSKPAENNDPAQNGGNPDEITGEVFDAGNVSAMVPKGWKAFPVSDIFSDVEGATNPDQVQIVKGGETEFDTLTKPYIHVTYYGPNSSLLTPDKEWYDEATDIEPLTLGGREWKGFTGKSFDLPITVIWTEEDANDQQYQVNIFLETSSGKISLEDADVQAIIASITATGEAAAPEATAE